MADLSVIYSKTPKGLRARTSLIGGLSSHLMRVLVHIDGNSKAETILVKFDHLTQQDLMADLAQLEHEGYIRPATITRPNTQDWAPTVNFTPMVVEEYQSEEEIEAKARAEAEAKVKEKAEAKVKAQLEAEAKARETEEAKKKAEAEQKAKAEQTAKLEAERKAKTEAEAKMKAEQKAKAETEARLEAERKAKEEAQKKAAAEQKAREEAEQKAKAEQEARLEAERKTKAEMKAREEAEQAKAKAEAEAKENARRELERIGREAEEAQKKAEAEQKARVEAEARLEVERKAKEQAQAMARAEQKAREEAEQKARAEADARTKAEQKAQERAEKARTKAEADEKSKEEKERARLEIARVIREAEEARKKTEAEAKEARQEAKRKIKADEEAQIKAERKAKLDAEQTLTQAEDDEKARAEAYEKASLEMQRIGRDAEEERNKSAEKVNAEASEEAARLRASVEAEEKAKAAAKERARLEMERIAQEAEEERKKSATKARAKSAEKTKADAESSYEVEYINGDDDDDDWDDDEIEEKTREVAKLIKSNDKVEDDADDIEAIEKARQEAEELILEEAKLVAKEEAAEAAKLRAEARARARAWFATTLAIKRWIPKAIKATLIYVPLLALLLIGIMHFINLSMLAEPIEKLASESIGEPVTINEVRASLWPAPHFKLGNVVIGNKPGQKIEFVNVVPEASTLFEEVKVMKSVEIEGLVVEPENFSQPQQWINNLGKAKHLKVAQVSLKKIVIKIRDLELEPLEGKVGFTESHELKSINLNSADNAFAMELTPLGSIFDVALSATHWPLPVNPKFVFDELKAKGIVNQGRVDFSQVNGEIYGGKFTANAVVDWSYRWVVSGDFNIFKANISPMLKAFASGISIDGKLNLIGNFACNAAEAARLVDVPDVTANFDLSGGKINGINLESAVLTRGSQSLAGDSTHFDKLTGSLQLSGGHYQYRKLVLEAPQFRAQGNVDIMPNQDITGKLNTSLAAQSRRLSSSFVLTGKVGDVRRQ